MAKEETAVQKDKRRGHKMVLQIERGKRVLANAKFYKTSTLQALDIAEWMLDELFEEEYKLAEDDLEKALLLLEATGAGMVPAEVKKCKKLGIILPFEPTAPLGPSQGTIGVTPDTKAKNIQSADGIVVYDIDTEKIAFRYFASSGTYELGHRSYDYDIVTDPNTIALIRGPLDYMQYKEFKKIMTRDYTGGVTVVMAMPTEDPDNQAPIVESLSWICHED